MPPVQEVAARPGTPPVRHEPVRARPADPAGHPRHAPGGGTIINLSSVSGRFAVPGNAYYAATKHAVAALTDALRLKLAATPNRFPVSGKQLLVS
jgi:NAD(P)-dependent dehydrogenase (short-subunit alcohol dehydrogenase family)